MWLEVKARYVPPYQRSEGGEAIEIVSRKQLDTTQKRVLVEDKTPITRRTRQKATATVLDNDKVEIDLEGHGKSRVQAGIPGEFTYRVNHPMVVERQDVVVWGRNDTMHGLLWVDNTGERKKPVYVQHGRNFYEGDSDPAALDLFRRLKEEEEAHNEGRLIFGPLVSAGGIVVGLDHELALPEDTRPPEFSFTPLP